MGIVLGLMAIMCGGLPGAVIGVLIEYQMSGKERNFLSGCAGLVLGGFIGTVISFIVIVVLFPIHDGERATSTSGAVRFMAIRSDSNALPGHLITFALHRSRFAEKPANLASGGSSVIMYV